jgi:hypothetical protein
MQDQQLQMQIGEYLSNLITQLDQKINIINSSMIILDQKMNQILLKMDAFTNDNYKNNSIEFDTDTKRKISQVKKERELNRILEKEKKIWENECAEQDRLIELAREEWEKENRQMKTNIDEDHSYSYLA